MDFFKRAFGNNLDEFNKLLWMPEKYIIYRNENIENGNFKIWEDLYLQLDLSTTIEFQNLIGDNIFTNKHTDNPIIAKLLKHYQI